MGKSTALLAGILAINTTVSVHADAFTIDAWTLGTVVENFESGESDLEGTTLVQNPFQDTHFVSIGLSTAQTDFDFSWTDTSGTFLIDAAHQAEDNSGFTLESRSSGFIFFETTTDLLFTIQSTYDYDLPASLMAIDIGLSIRDSTSGETFFADSESASTFSNPPPASGSLFIEGDGILPGGRSMVFSYFMELETHGTTGTIATGSGNVSFQLTQVPEAHSAFLLLIPAIFALHRRPRGRLRAR